jgi:hypothetical protein
MPLRDPDSFIDPDDVSGPPYFADDRHAVHVGFLLGALMKAGFSVNVGVDGEGNYTGLLDVSIPFDDDLEPITVLVRVLP